MFTNLKNVYFCFQFKFQPVAIYNRLYEMKYSVIRTAWFGFLLIYQWNVSHVTKTIANLTTYSRKPGDYNVTINFEIDIHIFCQCQNQNNTYFLLDSQHSQLSFKVNSRSKQKKQPKQLWKSQVWKRFKLFT